MSNAIAFAIPSRCAIPSAATTPAGRARLEREDGAHDRRPRPSSRRRRTASASAAPSIPRGVEPAADRLRRSAPSAAGRRRSRRSSRCARTRAARGGSRSRARPTRSGASSARIAPMRSSCAGKRYACRRHTATDSIPSVEELARRSRAPRPRRAAAPRCRRRRPARRPRSGSRRGTSGGGLAPERVVHVRDPQASQLEHVAEPARGEERGDGPAALEHGVRRDGRPVHDRVDRGRRRPRAPRPPRPRLRRTRAASRAPSARAPARRGHGG